MFSLEITYDNTYWEPLKHRLSKNPTHALLLAMITSSSLHGSAIVTPAAPKSLARPSPPPPSKSDNENLRLMCLVAGPLILPSLQKNILSYETPTLQLCSFAIMPHSHIS